MSTSEITAGERQGAQHLASLMKLALGSAAGVVGSHQQGAQAAREAGVRGRLGGAAGLRIHCTAARRLREAIQMRRCYFGNTRWGV